MRLESLGVTLLYQRTVAVYVSLTHIWAESGLCIAPLSGFPPQTGDLSFALPPFYGITEATTQERFQNALPGPASQADLAPPGVPWQGVGQVLSYPGVAI